VPKKLIIKGSKTVNKILTDAGLSPIYLGGSTPPIIHYEGNAFDKEVEIEFLTDKSYDREKDAIKVQDGLIAEALDYLKICIDNTMNINVVVEEIGDRNKILRINIPKPAAFVFNKGIVFARRKDPEKQAKDLYYIFNFISYSESLCDEIIKGLKQLSSKYSANWINTFKSNLDKYFIKEPKTGIEMVIEQRPAGDFPEMEESQFRNYVENIFIKFIESINY
jgi:hypothetical protein